MTAPDTPTPRLAVTRVSGVVVVTARGELDGRASAELQRILEDLIDGQGNLSMLVDLHDAHAPDDGALSALAWAAERSRRRGGTLVLACPPGDLYDALWQMGVGGVARRCPPTAQAAS
jgi:anti-anti-sigma factor